MTDNYEISWKESQDPSACNSNETVYMRYSRDPCRTPFQWDATANGGFNRGAKPWLPVNRNYINLNLEAQKDDPKSFFNLYKGLIRLRKNDVFRYGSTEAFAYKRQQILAVYRTYKDERYITLMSLSSFQNTIDLSDINEEFKTYTSGMVVISSKNFQPGEIEVASDDHPIVRFDKFVMAPYSTAIVKPLTRVCSYV